eukprot:6182089-Pleurochrysis_carterae.AAC.2
MGARDLRGSSHAFATNRVRFVKACADVGVRAALCASAHGQQFAPGLQVRACGRRASLNAGVRFESEGRAEGSARLDESSHRALRGVRVPLRLGEGCAFAIAPLQSSTVSARLLWLAQAMARSVEMLEQLLDSGAVTAEDLESLKGVLSQSMGMPVRARGRGCCVHARGRICAGAWAWGHGRAHARGRARSRLHFNSLRLGCSP